VTSHAAAASSAAADDSTATAYATACGTCRVRVQGSGFRV
jgi:ferredoxin